MRPPRHMLPNAALIQSDTNKFRLTMVLSKAHLARTVSTTTANTGDTCDGTTGTPRLGTGLVTSLNANGIRLSLVLGDALYSAKGEA